MDGREEKKCYEEDDGNPTNDLTGAPKGGPSQIQRSGSNTGRYKLTYNPYGKLKPRNGTTRGRSKSPQTWQQAEMQTRLTIGNHNTSARTFNTSAGKRVVDAYNPSTQVIAESKMGKVSLTERISSQVAKDVEILYDPAYGVNSVEWHFYYSPYSGSSGLSNPLRNLLMNEGIHIIIHP